MMNKEQEVINSICHKNNICFIGANTYGLAVRIFCDFGDSFTVTDYDDSEPVSMLVGDISKVISSRSLNYRTKRPLSPLRRSAFPSRKAIRSPSRISAV